jgi:hypothetical protein
MAGHGGARRRGKRGGRGEERGRGRSCGEEEGRQGRHGEGSWRWLRAAACVLFVTTVWRERKRKRKKKMLNMEVLGEKNKR